MFQFFINFNLVVIRILELTETIFGNARKTNFLSHYLRKFQLYLLHSTTLQITALPFTHKSVIKTILCSLDCEQRKKFEAC